MEFMLDMVLVECSYVFCSLLKFCHFRYGSTCNLDGKVEGQFMCYVLSNFSHS